MNTKSFRRLTGGATRAGLVALVVVAAAVSPAWAQEQSPAREQAMRRAFSRAIATAVADSSAVASSAAGAGDDQAPTPPPPSTMDQLVKFFSGTEVSGFVDFYYLYNFNKVNPVYRSFDIQHNSFTMSLAEVALEKKPAKDSRGGYRIDLDYGPTAAVVVSTEVGRTGNTPNTTVYQNIEQAYVSYLADTGSGLQLDFGKFVTPVGFEVIESKDNWNYTRGLLFNSIPFYHVGVRANYAVNDQWSLAFFLVNGWNQAVDINNGKTIAAQVTYKPTSEWSIIENYMGGPEAPPKTDNDWRHLSDTIVSYTATKNLSIAANLDYEKDGASATKWWGIAGYVKYQCNDWFAVSPRFEYLNDEDGFLTGTAPAAQKLEDGTLTLEFKHKDGVMARVEYRHDFSSPAFFVNSDGVTKKGQDTLTVGITYAFSTKNP